MLKTVVTLGCAAAIVAAVVLTVRLRDTRRTPSPLSGSEPFRDRLAVTVGRTGGMVFGAVVAGVFTVGAGGRLLMRILAATSPDRVQGRLTDAEEVVGEVSVSGSVFLVVGIGIGSGVAGLALFSLLRRWLPSRSVAAGLVGVAIGAGLLVRPSGLLSSTNEDFTLLSPVALAVVICVAMFALFGATFGVLVDHLASRWPRPGWNLKGVASVLPFALLAPMPPLFIATFVVVFGWAFASQGTPIALDGPGTRAARTLVVALGGIGGLSIVAAAGEVLAV